MLNFHKISPAEWVLTQPASPHFEWCWMRCILQVLGTVTDKLQWPLSIDMCGVIKVPELQELDKKKEEAEKLSRKEDKIKQGREEDMTVRLLREGLDEMGVVFNRTSKKAELIQKVKEARKEKSNAADSSPSSQGFPIAQFPSHDCTPK